MSKNIVIFVLAVFFFVAMICSVTFFIKNGSLEEEMKKNNKEVVRVKDSINKAYESKFTNDK